MKTLSKKLAELLFGSRRKLDGRIPLRANLSIPKLDGGQKTVHWEGNRALIFYLYEKIEKLEQEVEELKSKNK